MNNSFTIEDNTNSVVITSGTVVQQFPKNALYIISDDTDVILLRTLGSRKNVAELLWSWVSGASSKSDAIDTITALIFA